MTEKSAEVSKINKYPANPILFIDDEKMFLDSCSITLGANGINNVVTCHDSRNAMPILNEHLFSAVLLDINMPHISGMEILKKIVEEFPFIPVIMLSALNDIEKVVETVRHGAYDYLVKPIRKERLISSLKRVLERSDLENEVSALRKSLLTGKLEYPEAFSKIVTNNKIIFSIFQYLESIAPTSWPILITGETGVGKENFARAIHDLSGREGDFVTVNAAGVDDAAFTDTLFGHTRGAFTGAVDSRKGMIEMAAGGSLFLDEIGDLTTSSQIKLLRLLQEGEYYPLGSDILKKSNTRVITSTNKDIQALSKKGEFRNDLYFRLSSHQINIPPLRHRLDDLYALVEHFVVESSFELGKIKPAFTKELITVLKTYTFPGNIRELQSLIFDAVSRHKKGILSNKSIKQAISQTYKTDNIGENGEANSYVNPEMINIAISRDKKFPTLKEAEDHLVNEAMKKAGYNQATAAELLGLTRGALNKRLIRKKDLLKISN